MPESRGPLLPRVAALIAGLVILLGAAAISVGLALCAPLGVWVAHRFRRARGQSLGAWTSWFGAVGATVVGLLLVAGILASRVPGANWSSIRHAADSASAEAAKQPPPAWLSRIAPDAATRYSVAQSNTPTFVNTFALIWGLVIGVSVLGGILGTVGWFGSVLLVFYASGRWLRAPPPLAVATEDV